VEQSEGLEHAMNLYLLTRRDITAIFLAVAIICGLLFVYVALPDLGLGWSSQGFDPNWECSNPGHGESICIKRPAENQTLLDRRP
jgi:hypothetical protein